MVVFSVPATVVLVLTILPPLETAGDARVLLCGTVAILVVSVVCNAVGVAVVAVVEIFSNAVLTTPAVWSAGMSLIDVPVDANAAVVVALVADVGVIRVRDVVGLNAPPPSACSC